MINVRNVANTPQSNLQTFKGKNLKFNSAELKEQLTARLEKNDFQSLTESQKADVLKKLSEFINTCLGNKTKIEPRTIDFMDAYREHKDLIFNQNLYKKIIERCKRDIDLAIIQNRPQKEIDKLFDTLEIFTTRYGHYGT